MRKKDKSASITPHRKTSLNLNRGSKKHDSIKDKKSRSHSREFSANPRRKLSTKKTSVAIDDELNQQVTILYNQNQMLSLDNQVATSKPQS